jgi:hypothetical protein
MTSAPHRAMPARHSVCAADLPPLRCAPERHRSQPLRHQVWEPPEIKPSVTEYQRHRLICRCSTVTCDALSAGVPTGQAGPRLIARISPAVRDLREGNRSRAEGDKLTDGSRRKRHHPPSPVYWLDEMGRHRLGKGWLLSVADVIARIRVASRPSGRAGH